MKNPAHRLRRAPTPPGRDTGAFTFLDIGRRLRVLGEEYNAVDLRRSVCAQFTAEYRKADGAMSLLLDEEIALQTLVLSMEPKTLEDAAVQLGCLFMSLQRAGANVLSSQEIEREFTVAERVSACLTSVVCRVSGVNPDDTGTRDMSQLLASHCPSHAVEPDAAEVGA